VHEREVDVFGLGPTELIIVVIVALIVFGPSRLPKVGQMLGETVGNYKKMKTDLEDMILGPPGNN
jgi:sec-independent protein translocase protein TatA